MTTNVDNINRSILQLLIEDAGTTRAEIGRQLKLAPSAVSVRIKELTESGVIRSNTVTIDLDLVGLTVVAFVFVTEDKPSRPGQTLGALADLGIAAELHRLTGDDCFMLKLICTDNLDLRHRLDLIGEVPTVRSVRTQLVLESMPGSPMHIPGSESQ